MDFLSTALSIDTRAAMRCGGRILSRATAAQGSRQENAGVELIVVVKKDVIEIVFYHY
ncbi:hypothetical protein D3C73_1425990 [compost metagenome]